MHFSGSLKDAGLVHSPGSSSPRSLFTCHGADTDSGTCGIHLSGSEQSNHVSVSLSLGDVTFIPSEPLLSNLLLLRNELEENTSPVLLTSESTQKRGEESNFGLEVRLNSFEMVLLPSSQGLSEGFVAGVKHVTLLKGEEEDTSDGIQASLEVSLVPCVFDYRSYRLLERKQYLLAPTFVSFSFKGSGEGPKEHLSFPKDSNCERNLFVNVPSFSIDFSNKDIVCFGKLILFWSPIFSRVVRENQKNSTGYEDGHKNGRIPSPSLGIKISVEEVRILLRKVVFGGNSSHQLLSLVLARIDSSLSLRDLHELHSLTVRSVTLEGPIDSFGRHGSLLCSELSEDLSYDFLKVLCKKNRKEGPGGTEDAIMVEVVLLPLEITLQRERLRLLVESLVDVMDGAKEELPLLFSDGLGGIQSERGVDVLSTLRFDARMSEIRVVLERDDQVFLVASVVGISVGVVQMSDVECIEMKVKDLGMRRMKGVSDGSWMGLIERPRNVCTDLFVLDCKTNHSQREINLLLNTVDMTYHQTLLTELLPDLTEISEQFQCLTRKVKIEEREALPLPSPSPELVFSGLLVNFSVNIPAHNETPKHLRLEVTRMQIYSNPKKKKKKKKKSTLR
eukprot:TRINITY_DN16663_c0_g1_i1.p1 TRINITY_DN16663_c0_g1~~TRINITY_DN16663_c0_g1_i1.p1  ORF type:complete len:618 (-),score=119.24 TRINITY_DN16663_c0_g1_i1:12-1865(-)